jgi:GNAT superfamily N-acetyltransferase
MIKIRPIQKDDHASWKNLWAAYLKFYQTDLDPEITDQTWKRMHDDIFGLVAINAEEKVVGFVHYVFHPSTWSKSNICYLEDLFVDENSRNCGVATLLIEAVYEEARKKNASQTYWITQEFNHSARKVYDKLADLTPFVRYKKIL